jgi:hypothetical protein
MGRFAIMQNRKTRGQELARRHTIALGFLGDVFDAFQLFNAFEGIFEAHGFLRVGI